MLLPVVSGSLLPPPCTTRGRSPEVHSSARFQKAFHNTLTQPGSPNCSPRAVPKVWRKPSARRLTFVLLCHGFSWHPIFPVQRSRQLCLLPGVVAPGVLGMCSCRERCTVKVVHQGKPWRYGTVSTGRAAGGFTSSPGLHFGDFCRKTSTATGRLLLVVEPHIMIGL